jgi:hypothetical protein
VLKDEYASLFFDEAPFNHAAIQPETYLIVGRRGSGKTALAQYFAFQNVIPNPIVITVDEPAVYEQVLAGIAVRTSTSRQIAISQLVRLWEYILWSLLGDELRNVSPLLHDTSTALLSHRTPGQSIRSNLERFASTVEADDRLDKQLDQVFANDRISEKREEVLRVASRRPIVLTIDTLERYEIHDELMNAWAALIQYAASFNLHYRDRSVHLKVFMSGEVFPLLREEIILNPLKSIRQPVHLLWRPRDLLRLICWRLYRHLDANNLLDRKWSHIDWEDQHDVLNKIWRPHFGWELTNTRGLQEATFPYVLRHTQMRPRQLILLCNAIAERAMRRGEFPHMRDGDIRSAISDVQGDLAAEVINSFSLIYPQAAQIVGALHRMPSIFNGNELDRRAKESACAWPPGMYSPSSFRQFVAQLGIVGRVLRQNDADGYVDAEFEYSSTDRLIISPRDVCVIHPMFWERLSVAIIGNHRVMPFSSEREAREAEGGDVRHYKREVRSFLRLSLRAESVDRAKLVDTFVSAGPLITLLKSTDHQVIYGRRGTGKTHALLYLDNAVRGQGDLAAYIDLRMMGSSGGLNADANVSLAERATRLAMDVLGALHEALREQVLRIRAFDAAAAGPLLDAFADAITEVIVTGTIQTDDAMVQSESASHGTSGSLSLGKGGATLNLRADESGSRSGQQSMRVTRSGISEHRIHFGRVGTALHDLMKVLSPRRFWVLLDEWSDVPAELQPFLADLLRRSFFALPRLTVKIASIEQRTNLLVAGARGDYVGIEVGADASANINLDDFMVFENNEERATKFLLELIFNHVKALDADDGETKPFRTQTEVLRAFTQRATFEELVRAAEGVPRDAFNILSLAAQRALDSTISIEDIRTAAKTWYQRDKEKAATANGRAKLLLRWIVDEVIGHRRARAFLLRSDERHELIDALFDARVLHILKRDITSTEEPGLRYDAYKIDYGCYVDLLTTARGPNGLFLDGETATEVNVPSDDFRSIRRAVLDLQAFELG